MLDNLLRVARMTDQARQLREEISDIEQRILHFPVGSPEWIGLEKQRIYKSALHMRLMFTVDDAMRSDGNHVGTETRSGQLITSTSPLSHFIQHKMESSQLSQFGETVEVPKPKGCLSTVTILALFCVVAFLFIMTGI